VQVSTAAWQPFKLGQVEREGSHWYLVGSSALEVTSLFAEAWVSCGRARVRLQPAQPCDTGMPVTSQWHPQSTSSGYEHSNARQPTSVTGRGPCLVLDDHA